MSIHDDPTFDGYDDLIWLADQEPRHGAPDAAATARALTALRAHTTQQHPPVVPSPGHAPARTRRFARRPATRAGALLVTAAAAAVAVTIGVGSLPSHDRGHDPLAGLAPSSAQAAPLVRLARKLSAAPPATGDATLTIQHTVINGKPAQFSPKYNLVTDDTLLDYFATDPDGLADAKPVGGSRDPDDTTGPGTIHAWLTAAAVAADDSPADAAARINAASGIPIWPTTPRGQSREAFRKAQFDNHVWIVAESVLELNGGRPDIRAGALNAMAAVGANVVPTTTPQGRPVIQITMTQTVQNQDYYESMTIDARTGTPIRLTSGHDLDNPDGTTTYDVSRVNAADYGH